MYERVHGLPGNPLVYLGAVNESLLGNHKGNQATSAPGMTRRAIDVAKAMNTLLSLSGDGQEALLDVIQDYFCEPDPLQEDEDEISEDILDHEQTFELEGTL